VARLPIDAAGPSVLFAPVYLNGEWSHFAGFDLPEGYDACLKSVSLVDDLRNISLPMQLTLAPRWRSSALFQRLASWEDEPRAADALPLVRVQPADLVAPSEPHITRAAALWTDALASGVTKTAAGGWTGRITVGAPQQTLVQFSAQPIEAGAVLRVTGVLHRGGLQIGVSQDERVFDSRSVTTTGPFMTLIQEPVAGTFGARVNDFSRIDWRLEPQSILRQAAWLSAPWLRVDAFELHDAAWIRIGH
jgi:hypothetical protein